MEAQTRSLSTASQSLNEKILLTVAEAEGVDPLDLSSPLYDVVDPEALECLFADENRAVEHDLTVSFEYLGWQVTIHDGGDVTLTKETETTTFTLSETPDSW